MVEQRQPRQQSGARGGRKFDRNQQRGERRPRREEEVVEKIWGFKLSGEQKERVEIYLIKNLNVPIGKAEIWWEYILHNHTKAFDLFNYIKVLSKDVN